MQVSAICERKAAKGRVTCEVELEVATGRVAWADVVVVSAPAFAPPLRSRVGMGDARARTERRVRIPVAFIATGTGRGAVVLRARAAVCEASAGGSETCRPGTGEARAELVVGADIERSAPAASNLAVPGAEG